MNKERWDQLYEQQWAACRESLSDKMKSLRHQIIENIGLYVTDIEEGATDTRYFDMTIRKKDLDYDGRSVRAKFELNDSFAAAESFDGFNVIFELVTNDAHSIFNYSPFNFNSDCWSSSSNELVFRIDSLEDVEVFDCLVKELIDQEICGES